MLKIEYSYKNVFQNLNSYINEYIVKYLVQSTIDKYISNIMRLLRLSNLKTKSSFDIMPKSLSPNCHRYLKPLMWNQSRSILAGLWQIYFNVERPLYISRINTRYISFCEQCTSGYNFVRRRSYLTTVRRTIG